MKSPTSLLQLGAVVFVGSALYAVVAAQGGGTQFKDPRAAVGLSITPVKLTFHQKDAELVGIGSYLVNAVGSCNDCHTCPAFGAAHNNNPFTGGPGRVNATNYLAGGTAFGPFISPNLTPKVKGGLPEQGHTLEEFVSMMRTGRDADDPTRILQVMPWPILRNMTDDDLRAIYEYLKAIPPAQPGSCAAPG